MKFKKFISSSLAIGLLLNSTSISLASILSEDGRYETFEGSNITINDVLEEDKVDVEIEGNTMVNVANQKDPVPITKSYTVEGANHIPLQGEYDGKARPVIEGNTLVNLLDLNLRDREATASNPTSIDSKNKEISWDWSIGQVYNNWIQIDNKLNMAQPNKTYTLIVNIKQNNPMLDGELINLDIHGQVWIPNCGVIFVDIPNGKTGICKWSFTTTKDVSRQLNMVGWKVDGRNSNGDVLINGGKLIIGDIMLLEGDWTNKEIPRYFEGLKSSFEDQLVTQEMVDSGQEKAENLGKYKVEYKVTGKNLLKVTSNQFTKGLNAQGHIQANDYSTDFIPFNIPSSYYGQKDSLVVYFENTELKWCSVVYYNAEKKRIGGSYQAGDSYYKYIAIDSGHSYEDVMYVKISCNNAEELDNMTAYIGKELDCYEDVKSYTKTFYLNSPLLEGDTIEDIDGRATHVKRCNQVILDGSTNLNAYVTPDSINDTNRKTLWAILDRKLFPDRGHTFISNRFKFASYIDDVEGIGFGGNVDLMIEKSKLISLDNLGLSDYFSKNPTTIVYRLVNPIYETISEESILCESYASGHLDLNSNIPVNKVDFIPTNTNLNYLYSSTEYTVQFESDNKGKIDKILLGDKVLYSNYLVKKGFNKLNITTPSTILSTELILDGIGFNLSKLIVTQSNNDSFDYFEGTKSVGQGNENGHNIEILSANVDDINFVRGNIFMSSPPIFSEVSGGTWLFNKNPIVINTKRNDVLSWDLNNKNNDMYIEKMVIFKNGEHVNSHAWFGGNSQQLWSLGEQGEYEFHFVFAPRQGVDYCVEVKDLINNFRLYVNDKPIEWIPKSNKKEIPLSEPLRGLPNGVKDRIVKRNGQWVVERKVKEVIIDSLKDLGQASEVLTDNNITTSRVHIPYREAETLFPNIKRVTGVADIMCDKLPSKQVVSNMQQEIQMAIGKTDAGVSLRLEGSTVEECERWLNNNPLTIMYEMNGPIYESLKMDSKSSIHVGTTHISNNSVIPANMKTIIDRTVNIAVEHIERAKANPTTENLSKARYWSNLLKESIKKDQLQSEISNITNIDDLQLDRKSASANLDIYVKSQNMLSLSLDTNSITFDGYSGAEDMEMLGAVNISINSSLPYQLNAYISNGIANADKSEIMPIDTLNIRENSEGVYQTFANTTDKVVLKDGCNAGNGLTHNIDLKLSSNLAHKADVYKTVIKFEAEQK